jgi:CHAP domain
MKTLLLTSPNMKGSLVKEAQQTLSENVFKQNFLQGDIDGEFGPESMRACKRAKYWLGYVGDNQKGTYGEFLHKQLKGERKLSDKQAARRKDRLEKAKQRPLRLKALDEARKDIGMTEHPPNSNISEISKWYKMTGPWCAMGVTQWYVMAGSKGFLRSQRWAYCPFILQAAIRGDYGLALTRNPQEGDIVLFDWDDDGIADHTGVLSTRVNEQGNFKSIEANTAVGNDSNGGEVMERDRHVSQLVTSKGRHVFIHAGR